MSRIARVTAVLTMLGLGLSLVACGGPKEEAPTPKIEPPAIHSAGVLKAGVDLSTPPYAGVDGKRTAGIDVDIAAAIASELGLSVEYVDVKPSEAATALADGSVDVVLSVPFADADLARVSPAGTYLAYAPAFFVTSDGASVEPSMTLETMKAAKIGAQKESPAYWILASEFGEQAITAYDTLREALEALDQGEVEVVAGDTYVGVYIARDLPRIKVAGQLADAQPLAVVVAPESAVLGDAVRSSLDAMVAGGVVEQIKNKWVGEAPELKAAEVATDTAE